MTDKQFDEFVNKCYEQLEQKQEKIFDIYNIGSYEEYWFDQTTKKFY
jgi:hypothetical protein